MNRTNGREPDARDARERRRAREALLADREQAARVRARRRVGLRPPSALPAAVRPARGGLRPGRPSPV